MEYPAATVGALPPNYQHSQEQPHISPGCNVQQPGPTFSGSEGGAHNRNYTTYPQPYPPAIDYAGSQPASGYPPGYPTENQGQSLTLNQLLQQGNASGSFQSRPQGNITGQAPYRTYEPFPYGYKHGQGNVSMERPQANIYSYGNQRYPDPYIRSPYAGYPPSSAYPPYYQPPVPPQRHSAVPHPSSQSDYSVSMSNSVSPRPPQSTTPAGVATAVSGDRPPSRGMSTHQHSSSMSPAPQLSSPDPSTMPNMSPSSRQMHGPPFGSPRLQHGLGHQQQFAVHRTTRDSQQSKPKLDPSVESHGSSYPDQSYLPGHSSPLPHSRVTDNSRTVASPSSTGTFREPVEDQTDRNPVDSHATSSTEGAPANSSAGTHESTSSLASFTSSTSSVSPAHVPRSTPPIQSPAAYSQPLPSTTSPIIQGTQSSPGGAGSPRLPCTLNQQFRPYGGPPIQNNPVARHPYPLNPAQGQPPPPTSGQQYMFGNRVPLHPGSASGYAPRPAMGGNMGACPPRPSQFSAQSGTIMPPPAPPPLSSANHLPPGSSPLSHPQQPGFPMVGPPYAPSNAAYGGPLGDSTWDAHSSTVSSGVPTNAEQQQQQQQPGFGRPTNAYGERAPGYSSPQSAAGATSGPVVAGGPASVGVGQQNSLSNNPICHHPPSQYHPQASPYHQSSVQPPIPPSSSMPTYSASASASALSMGQTGMPPRDQIHAPYSHSQALPDRGAPPFFGAPGQTGPVNEHSYTCSSPMGLTRMPTMGAGGPGKTNQSGSGAGGPMVKGQRVDSGVRPSNTNHISGLPMNAQPGLSPNAAAPVGSGLDDGLLGGQQPPSQPHASMPTSNQAGVHSFSGSGWPEAGPMNPASGPHGSHPFSSFSQQQQQQQQQQPQQQMPHYRPIGHPQMHPQYAHGLMNTASGAPVYGGSMMSHTPPHMHGMVHGISPQSSGGFQKLLEMGNEPERRPWLEHYVRFMEDIGKPLVGLPQVVKQPLDLYRFYLAVRERGGVLEVIKTRRWKEISQLVNINASASAAYTLRKNYCKFLLDYECRFDRGGADPRPILMHIEAMSGKKKKPSPGDVEPGTNSLSGLQMPAPPSPSGSHSSASSSLLPPGSGSASLSGVPTAGSAASDSQHGPSQPRTGDSSASLGATEGLNGISGSPAPSVISAGTPFMSGNMSSPQRPNSATSVVNGYGTSSQGASETSTRPWPWSSDSGPTATSQHSPSVALNGYPSSPAKGPIPAHPFDPATRSHRSDSPLLTKGASHSFAHGPCNSPASSSATAAGASGHPPPGPASLGSSAGAPSAQLFNNKPAEHGAPPHPSPFPAQHPGAVVPGMMPHHVPAPPPSAGPHRLCSPIMNIRQPPYFVNGSPANPTGGDPVAFLCMQQYRSAAPGQIPAHAQGGMPPFPGAVSTNAPGVPAHLIHHHGQRPGYVATILKRVEHYAFPPGSVEATPIDSTRRRRYRSKDVGPVVPVKLLMALRSGLTAEVAWALNCLNILLRDENGPEFLGSMSLPVLVTNLVDLWRHALGEVFSHELFIRSLELPANLNPSKSPSDREAMCHTMSDRHSCSVGLPKSLTEFEHELVALAAKRNVSVSSLRDAIKRALHKGDGRSLWFPGVRLRNGLITRTDSFNTNGNSLTNPTNVTASADSLSLRTRKRGRLSATSLTPNASSNSGSTTTVPVSGLSGMASSFAPSSFSTSQSVLNGIQRVITTSSGMGTPQSLANLFELALFALDGLTASESESLTDMKSSSNWVSNSPARTLQYLLTHGGGDSTCHIMPAFGASTVPSKHWRSGYTDVSKTSSTARDPLVEIQQIERPSTPPPVVLKEKGTPRDETNYEHDSLAGDEDDAHPPYAKRIRRASASSLGCPVLSPQPLDEIASDQEDQDCVARTTSDSTEKAKEQQYAPDYDGDDNDDREFSQLVMDSEGRCPLRAREELVHHGSSCLWPDDPETDCNEARAVRCLCVSTVLRNLSFITLFEHHLSSHKALLSLIGRVMLLGHDHVGPDDTWQTVELKAKALEASLCAWRTPSWLEDMRENALVLLVNIAGYLNLINLEESIVRPILEGLLHWIVCPTAASTDPFPGHRTLSPRRLALEAVNRLSVHQSNVDLLLSTPSVASTDLEKLFDRLANWLALPEDQVTRELALSTMHYLTGGGIPVVNPTDHVHGKPPAAESSSSSLPTQFIGTTMLAAAKPCPISGLLGFIEAAEAATRRVIEQFGVHALQERPELMGTSLEMVRRAGALLDRLAADPVGRKRFTPTLELRLIDLVTSRVLDATVAHLLCGALHRLSTLETPFPVTASSAVVPSCPSLAAVAQILKAAETESLTKDPPANPSQPTADDQSEINKLNSVPVGEATPENQTVPTADSSAVTSTNSASDLRMDPDEEKAEALLPQKCAETDLLSNRSPLTEQAANSCTDS